MKEERKSRRYFNREVFESSGPMVASGPHFEAIKFFLDEVERLEPQVINDLEAITGLYTFEVDAEVFSLREDTDYVDETGRIIGLYDIWDRLDKSIHPECLAFKSALLEWAHKWHLVDDANEQTFYLGVGIEAIMQYKTALEDFEEAAGYVPEGTEPPKLSLAKAVFYQDAFKDTLFHEQFPVSFNPTTRGLSLSNRGLLDLELYEKPEEALEVGVMRLGWDPRGNVKWEDFEGAIKAMFNEYMEAYKERALSFMREHRYEEVDVDSKDELIHFEWFVLFQIRGIDRQDIIEYYGKSDPTGKYHLKYDTVRKGLKSVSELVRLPLRKN